MTAVAMLCGACSKDAANDVRQAQTKAKTALTLGVSGEPDTLFGPFVTSLVGIEILAAGSAALVSLEQDGTWAPYAAERLPRFEDGSMRWLDDAQTKLVVTWKIRDDFHWPDGKPLVAADYAFGVTVCLDASLPVTIRSPCEGIESAVAAPDDPRTLIVTWAKPTMHATTGYLMPLPRHVLEAPYRESPDRFAELPFARKPMLAGPFTVEEWSPGSHITLTRNPHAGPSLRPRFDSITFRFIPHPSTMLANVKAGSIDGVWVGLGLDLAVSAQLPPQSTMQLIEDDKHLRIDMNLDRPPLNDVRVRRALLHAVDRESFNQRIYGGRAEISDAPLRRASPFFDAALGGTAFDLQKAAALLDEAGLARGADGMRPGIRLVLHTIVDRPAYEQLALVMQGAWRSIGVDVEIRAVPVKLLLDVWKYRTFDLILGGTDYDPTHIEPSWWTCASVPTKENAHSGLNSSGWCNAEVDKTLAALGSERDPAKRAALGKRFHALFVKDLPLAPLFFLPTVVVRPTALDGFSPTSWPGLAAHAERWSWR